MPLPEASEGRRRVAIERVQPSIDGGRFAIKRIVGQRITVTADAFADGHDVVLVELLDRAPGAKAWQVTPMTELGNDAWQAELELAAVGRHEFTIRAWVDAFASWHRDLKKRIEAGQDVGVDLQIGAPLVEAAAQRANEITSDSTTSKDARRLTHFAKVLAGGSAGVAEYQAGATELSALAARYPDYSHATQCDRPFAVVVDRQRAEFSTWYELFPRSCADEEGRHGTFADCARWLPRLAAMGFDVVYLPPIHPIGSTFRKGKNNAVSCEPGDVGSPWAIGSAEGGHKAIHAELGTLDDLKNLIRAAGEHGIDLALDIAFQCAPEHPYVKEHPDWFKHRPDGTIQYAENPPKKYQDIYPFDFESSDWRGLWQKLTDVVLYWARQGVRIFRVDNPHTKALAFWEFLISEVKAEFPEAIFLAEAFTRPKIMYRLAKLGFSQSYTYFTWRNTKAEFTEYLTELTAEPVSEFFRPNFWPNTPDILPPHLQSGNRAAFIARLVLAGTLSGNYGIYGPAYENLDHLPLKPGSEEYLNSEKYQLRHWNFDMPGNLTDAITRLNRARRENPALQSNGSLRFHPTDNEQLICYSKHCPASGNLLVMVVNLDFQQPQWGHVELPLAELGIDPGKAYHVVDALSDGKFDWQGPRNFVKLDPAATPAHVLLVRQS